MESGTEEIKTAVEPSTQTTAPAQTEPAKEVDVKTLSSDEIKASIEKKLAEPVKPEVKEEVKPEVKETPKEEEWFNKEKGWKTKEDAEKSHSELMNTLRERSEHQKKIEAELAAIKQKAAERPLTEEEITREKAVQEWENQNKDAIEFLEKRISERLEKKKVAESFEQTALNERKSWKENFDKDESRRVLWPTMEKIYAEKNFFQEIAKNPFEAIEALAFKKDFPTIAEKIRAEAIEQYKASIKEAEVAERRGKTETPGGPKTVAGELDVKKLKSSEIANLLRREDE